MRVIESNRAVYFENEFCSSQVSREIVFKEERIFIPVPVASAFDYEPAIDQIPV